MLSSLISQACRLHRADPNSIPGLVPCTHRTGNQANKQVNKQTKNKQVKDQSNKKQVDKQRKEAEGCQLFSGHGWNCTDWFWQNLGIPPPWNNTLQQPALSQGIYRYILGIC